MTILRTIPARMFSSSYTARKERMVVNVPAPAINGKASGTIEPEPFACGSSLIYVIPRIISMATMKITMAPATANDATSNPKSWRIDCLSTGK